MKPTTTQTAHTPGPWENKYPVIMAGSARLARIECTPEMDKYDEANARLIAAAPELLAALKALVALDEYQEPFNGLDFTDARLAISKAEGNA